METKKLTQSKTPTKSQVNSNYFLNNQLLLVVVTPGLGEQEHGMDIHHIVEFITIVTLSYFS